MSKLWTEEEAAPPTDLRLVPLAAAAWTGALLGLKIHGWPVALLRWWIPLLVGCGLVLSFRGMRRWAGGVTAAAGFLAALFIAALYWQTAAHNPLTVASARGSWAVVQLTVTTTPRQLASVFPIADDASGSGSGSGTAAAAPTQELIGGRATSATIGTTEFDLAADIAVMAVGGRWPDLVPGERIEVGGLLRPDSYSVLPGAVVNARTAPRQLQKAPWWQRDAASIRRDLVDNAGSLSVDAKGLLPGLVVGNTDGISPALTADAKVTGLSHLLAVSGSHFAVLCGLAILLLRRLGPRIASAGGAVVLIALVVLVGPGASVLRAAVMGSIALVAMALGRSRSALPALSAAVTALLLYDPTLALSVGFALSVQATAGLILLAPAWSRALQRRGCPAGWADLLAVPVAASVVTMPVVAALRGAVSLASIPANLLAAVVVGPALVIGMGSALTGPWWPSAARLLARVDQPLLEWIAFVAHRLARWQSASLPWPASVPGVLGLTGLLTIGLLVLRHHRIRALALAAAVGAAIVLVPAQVVSVGWPPPGWVLTACEIGQGDGMVLSTGEVGTGIVVDAGPDPALMDACLNRLHVTTVPLVVLTHLHADHVGGLSGVLAGRSVGAVGVGPDRDAPGAWHTITALAAQHGVPVVGLPKNTQWGSGALTFRVLGPDGPFRGTNSDENNDSVVLMAHIAGVDILMTGDIENEAQQQLLDDSMNLRADVLEQPHHGSARVLPAFVDAVHPKVSAIGVGRDNDYGQPSPKALAQLERLGTLVLRTDLQGDAAVCVVDGRLSTVTRGVSLPAGSSKGGGRSDGA